MFRISKIITFLESLRQAGWFDIFESDIQVLIIFDPLITLWGNFDAPYLKLLNDASMASACSYVRTCRWVRNSKKIATIRDFHLPGPFLCLSTRLKPSPLFARHCFSIRSQTIRVYLKFKFNYNIDIEYNKRLDRWRPCFLASLTEGRPCTVQSNKSVLRCIKTIHAVHYVALATISSLV